MVVSARGVGPQPNAQNNSDSNAAKRTPSQGAFQFIEPTFRAYHEPGTSTNLRDPVARPRRSSITPWAGTTFQLTGRISRRRFSRPTRRRSPRGY